MRLEDVDRFAEVVLALVKSQNAPIVDLLSRLDDRVSGLETRQSTPGRDGRDGERGARGEVGLQGIQGEKGEAGEKGAQGDVGQTGAQGPQGEKGDKGESGEAGPQGLQGEKGLDGMNGAAGRDGIDGKDGRDGFGPDDFRITQDGKSFTFTWTKGDVIQTSVFTVPVMVYRGVWEEGVTYTVGDTVTWAGSCWVCSVDTSGKPGLSTDESRASWKMAVRKGQDGRHGKDGEPGKNGKDGKDRF